MLKKRQDHIEETIKKAEEDKATAAINASKSQEMLIASKKEANEIIANAHEQAKVQSDEMLLATNQQIKKMKADAEKDIELSKKESLDAIHDEMVEVAISASSEILKREVSSADNKRLAEEFVKELSK